MNRLVVLVALLILLSKASIAGSYSGGCEISFDLLDRYAEGACDAEYTASWWEEGLITEEYLEGTFTFEDYSLQYGVYNFYYEDAASAPLPLMSTKCYSVSMTAKYYPNGPTMGSREEVPYGYLRCYNDLDFQDPDPYPCIASIPGPSTSTFTAMSSCEEPPPPDACHCCSCPPDQPEPLVLDLNGDGIHTTGDSSPVMFDLNADGEREALTWTDSTTQEGFLWLDLIPNNIVDDGSELFGIGTTLPSGEKAVDGFEALAIYDALEHGGNEDGLISAADAIWARLRIWIDLNHDGTSGPTETGPIHRYGVTHLYLEHTIDNSPDENGNIHLLRGYYQRRVRPDEEHLGLFMMHGLVFRRVEGATFRASF